MLENLYQLVRAVPDFPKPGIMFRDITPLLLSPAAFRLAIDQIVEPFQADGITKVVAIESRGFVLGAPVALALGAGLVLVRKPSKLPAAKRRVEYQLEYGTDALEVHADALTASDRVLIVDDVLATGGTAAATVWLVEQAGSQLLGLAMLIELADLDGRVRVGAHRRMHSVLRYPHP